MKFKEMIDDASSLTYGCEKKLTNNAKDNETTKCTFFYVNWQ